MKKIYLFGIAAALMMGTVALSSCSNDELTVGNEIAKEVAKTYSFSVPAIMDDEAGTRVFTLGESTISSKFSTTEPVYMFIEKEDGSNIAYGCYKDDDDNTIMALHPTNISSNGTSCTIVTDNLTFIPKTPGFEIEEGDKVYLYYGMTVEPDSNPLEGYFDFATDGSKAKAQSMDYNLAMTTIKSADGGVLTFNDTFNFTNINSIFRQKLTIVYENGAEIDYSIIVKVVISSANNKTVQRYYPFKDEAYEYGDGAITITSPDFTESTDIYFSTIFNDVNKNEAITFTAVENDEHTFKCTKAAPEDSDNPDNSGFKNNMYYYGGATLVMVEYDEDGERNDPVIPI